MKKLAFLIWFLSTFANAGQVSINVGTTVLNSSPYRYGRNIGVCNNYESGQFLKNVLGCQNAGNEPYSQVQIWQIQTGATLSTTQVQSNINDAEYDTVPANFWAGGTLEIIDPTAAPGSDVLCTRTITSNTVAASSPNGPVFTFPACPSAPVAGNLFKVSKQIPGTPQYFCSGGSCSFQTADLCAQCGTQTMKWDATSSAITGQWIFDNTGTDEYRLITGGTWTYTHWAKASVAKTITISASRSGGFSCGPWTEALTTTWTQYTHTCTPTETGTGTPQAWSINWSIPSGTVVLTDNEDFEKTAGNDGTNTSIFGDDYVAGWRQYMANSVTSSAKAATARYGPHPAASPVSNLLTAGQFNRIWTDAGIADYIGYNGSNLPVVGYQEYLQFAQVIGATPYIIFPISADVSDATAFVNFIHANGWDTTFNEIRVEVCNECWNQGTFAGLAMGFRSGAPDYYYDFMKRSGQIFTAMRSAATAAGVTNLKYMVGTQTAIPPSGSTVIGYAKPDTVLLNGYTQIGPVNNYTTTAALWVPALSQVYNMTHDSSNVDGFDQSVTAITGFNVCGSAGTATCEAAVYEQNNSTYQGSITQTYLDGFVNGAGYGTITANQFLEQLKFNVPVQNLFASQQYYFSDNGLNPHIFGDVVDCGGAAALLNGTNCMPRPQFLAAKLVNSAVIGPMLQTTLTSPDACNLASASNGVNATTKPCEFAYAFQNGSTSRTLVLQNLDPSTAHTVTFTGANAPSSGTTVSRQRLTFTNLTDKNEANLLNATNTTPAAVSIATSSLTSFNPSSSYSLPAGVTDVLTYALATETINWLSGYPATPSGGFSLIPNQQSTYYIAQSNYTTVGANFTITGGTILSSLNGAVTIQAPSSGSTCSFDATNRIVASATNVVITATPKDGGASAVSLTIPVCNPTPVHHNLPTFRLGVFKSQPVQLQCIVEATMNKSCSWSITTNPGSAGTLSDTNQRDTVFTATAPGRYIVTSTAAVDSSTATTIIDIPDNTALPYQATQNGTLPVNCNTDSNLTGHVYNVGPGQTYADLTALMTAITPAAGDTILIANQTVGNGTPTTLFNYLVLAQLGTQAQPIFLCGVPNAAGYLPAIDGTNATSAYPADQYFSGYGLLNTYNTSYSTLPNYPSFIQISGFALQNANNTQVYQATGSGNTTTNTWGSLPVAGNLTNNQCTVGQTNCPDFVAAIRIQNGGDINIIGNEMKYVGLAIFTEAKSPLSKMAWRVLVEGNYIHDFGYSTAASTGVTGGSHALYMQGYEQVIQGNHFDPAASTHQGGVYKDRGVVSFFRHNYLNNADTSSRNMDLVDQQDACYTNPMQFIACAGTGNTPVPDSGFSWDQMAGWNEAFNDEAWVYGNIHLSKALGPVHFNGDHGQYTNAPRLGHLHYYNNTLVCPSGCDAYDTKDPNTEVYAFPTIDTQNSIFWMDGAVSTNAPGISYLRNRNGFLNAVSLFSPLGAVTNNQASTNTFTPWTGWPGMDTTINANYYADYNTLSTHISGFGPSLGTIPNAVSTKPYNATTYVATSAGSVLPSGYIPVRFMFRPDLGYVLPRNTVVTTSTAGVIGPVDAPSVVNIGTQIGSGVTLTNSVVIK